MDDDVIEGTTLVAAPAPVDPVGAPLALTRGLVDTDAAKALAAVDRRIEFIKEVRARTVRLTLPQDWVDMGGKPYLEAQGLQRIKQPWGLYYRDLRLEPSLRETREELRAGRHVTVEVIGTAGSRITGEESVFLGGRSSEDGFFSDRKGGIEAMDAEDLRKSAVTNWEVRAMTDLLGLRGLTWEDLKRFGITASGAATRVAYAESGATKGDDSRAAMAAEIKAGLEQVHGAHAPEALYLLSKFPGKDGVEQGLKTWEALGKASEKWQARLVEKVRAEVAGHAAKPAPAAGVPA